MNRQNERRKSYKGMDEIRKEYHSRQEACRDRDENVPWDKEKIMNRFAEHFKDVLNEEYYSGNDHGKLDPESNIDGSDGDAYI